MRISIRTSPIEGDLFTVWLLMSLIECFFSFLMIILWILRIPFFVVALVIGFPVDIAIYGAKSILSWIYNQLTNKKNKE